ncbi:MAG: LytTR family DNA-binding domain-containing protein [Chitinophagaceae bacterium]|jgi:DNA-binding LytR/AlgR family response regulator
MSEKKIQCVVVDDEPAALQLMQRYVQRTPFLELKVALNNAIEVLNYLESNPAPELIFLDIQMPELNGLELSKNLPLSTKIIFTTAFDKYAIEGYKANAIGYLLKPIDYAEFLGAASKAKEQFSGTQELLLKTEMPDYFFIKSEYKQLRIYFSDILYIEGYKDYAKIHLASAAHPVLSLISLKKLEDELPQKAFMRIHRSYIINLNKIDLIERNQVFIKTHGITVAEPYRVAFNLFIAGKSI